MTVEELAREVVGSVDAEEGYLICQRWISNRYQEIAALLPLKTLLKFGETVIPGAYKTGTISVTKGSEVVTGVGTTWDASHVGWFLKRGQGWYEVEAVDSPTQLTLLSPYAETSATGTSYWLVKRRVPLAPGVRRLQVMRAGGRHLDFIGPVEMDLSYADRWGLSTYPVMAAEVGIDATVSPTVRLFEFFPYPREDCLVSYTYHESAGTLTMADNLPDFLDTGLLKEGVMIDLYRFEMGRALKEGRTNEAGFWRNELRAQETTWERRLREVPMNSGATDTGTFILRTGRGGRRGYC